VGKQQLVEIAKALSKNVKLLIMDEPTAALNDKDSDALLNLILKLREERGISVIIISHKLEELLQEKVGIPVVNYGPGDPICAHQDNESVSVADLIQCTKVMALTIMDWCGIEE
jgi:ABC-type sugar transport system ATPase subunit